MIINLNSNQSPENENIDKKALQIETLQEVATYIPNLIKGINTVSEELSGEEKEDTWEYLRMIIDGFNWVIEAYNGTSDLINSEEKLIDGNTVSDKTNALGKAYTAKNGNEIANILKNDIIAFLNDFEAIAKKY